MIQILLLIIYVVFISLGLPDGLLGAAWPTMYIDIGVPISTAGIISMVIALGTIVSALFSDKLTYFTWYRKSNGSQHGNDLCCLVFYLAALLLWSITYELGAGMKNLNYVIIQSEFATGE